MALINVDFPTPELPESKVTFPSRSFSLHLYLCCSVRKLWSKGNRCMCTGLSEHPYSVYHPHYTCLSYWISVWRVHGMLPRWLETVNEYSWGFGIINCNNQHTLIQIGSQYVRLFGKVGGAPDDIVLAVFYLTDEGGSFIVDNDLYIISYSNGIGTPNTL